MTLAKSFISMGLYSSICWMGDQPLLAISGGHYNVRWNSMHCIGCFSDCVRSNVREGRFALAHRAEQYTPKCSRKQRGEMAVSVLLGSLLFSPVPQSMGWCRTHPRSLFLPQIILPRSSIMDTARDVNNLPTDSQFDQVDT